MLKLTQPLLLPLQQPYPLIAHDGNIYAQMATLLIQSDDGEIDSYPVLKMDYMIDGQVFSEDVKPDVNPSEDYFKIGCYMGDEISWQQFIGIARNLFNRKTDYSLTEIFETLEDYGVTVKDLPHDLYLFISSFDNGIDFCPGGEMAFKWRNHDDSMTEEGKYRDYIEQVAEHMRLLPRAELHFLHNREDDGFLSKLNQLEKDIADYVDHGHGRHPPTPHVLWPSEYVGIARYIKIKWLGRSFRNKDEVLQDVCRHFGLDEKCKEHVWNYLTKTFDIGVP